MEQLGNGWPMKLDNNCWHYKPERRKNNLTSFIQRLKIYLRGKFHIKR